MQLAVTLKISLTRCIYVSSGYKWEAAATQPSDYARGRTIRGTNSASERNFSLPQKCPDVVYSPLIFLFNGYRG